MATMPAFPSGPVASKSQVERQPIINFKTVTNQVF